jgi:hypothetical protein
MLKKMAEFFSAGLYPILLGEKRGFVDSRKIVPLK